MKTEGKTEGKKEIAWIKWGDACHSMAEHAIADLGDLAVLDEVGFVIKESADTITLATESQDEALSVRFWLTIPKANIIEIKRTTLEKAFKTPKPRPRKPKSPPEAPQ